MCVCVCGGGRRGESKAVECLCVTCFSRFDMFKNNAKICLKQERESEKQREGEEKKRE